MQTFGKIIIFREAYPLKQQRDPYTDDPGDLLYCCVLIIFFKEKKKIIFDCERYFGVLLYSIYAVFYFYEKIHR
jgi:hypothetical protein